MAAVSLQDNCIITTRQFRSSRATHQQKKSLKVAILQKQERLKSLYLFGPEFTLLGNIVSTKEFCESKDLPTHMAQRWRLQWIRYRLTVVHRPARMVKDVDGITMARQREREDEATKQNATEKGKALFAIL